jgi:hypothetical protein
VQDSRAPQERALLMDKKIEKVAGGVVSWEDTEEEEVKEWRQEALKNVCQINDRQFFWKMYVLPMLKIWFTYRHGWLPVK